ncbi:TonB-linked outer membrane protein, SusC/RagA family [Parapedobacter composti]|uniref:TonB-linked outer membrane protein, SusC/RagA family n=1 Tax=Parapedobacter composti TaxID=623281 RepID=A0A1I1L767_9SPHI|nr:TonB-dependent receptor [Parapedobacter composti]SFC68937.1 TonB-linked outer membrane protein, SusC/RagA family [Parapedobacter composti]
MRKLVCLWLLSVVYFSGWAQSVQVRGKVTNAQNGDPLIGVSISAKGSDARTSTDGEGNFTISAQEGTVLVFSYVGMETAERTVSGGVLNVAMMPGMNALDEIVAIGYGTVRKGDVSGSSVTVNEEQLKGTIVTNLDQALQGRAAGVTAVMTSGAPGGAMSIRVRGQSTINSNAEPLYVIDGVIVQGGGSSGASFGLGDALGNGPVSTISPLSTLNPADIVSLEILKDASATAIYGAQGANGVVLITTKRGQAGEAKFSYEGMTAIQSQPIRLNMMNLREFAAFSNDIAGEVNSRDARVEFRDPSLLGEGTNWQEAVFRHAPMQQHQLSAQGGSDVVKYYVSGSFMDQKGTVIGTNFNRYSFRSNLDAQLKRWLKLGLNAMYSSTGERLSLVDSDEGVVKFSLLTPPDIPIYDIDGNYASVVREGYTTLNPIAKALSDQILLDRTKLNGSIFADVTVIKDLVWHTELGFDISGSRAEVFEPTLELGNWKRTINMNAWQRNNNRFWQLKNYLTYTRNFGSGHHINAMLGQEAWESTNEFMRISATGLPSNDVRNPRLGEDPQINSGFGESAMSSFFGRMMYNYQDKYMGTYTYRRDGSSNFGPENRWASFHSFATSWRFSNEQFFEPLKHVVSNGKIRVGWGQTGNSSIGSYLWGASISMMPTGLGPGYRQSNIANPYIQWETQEQWNFGLDLGFFNDRLTLVADWYDKTSRNMLMPLQLPSYMGTRGNASSALASPMGNYGTINNKGFEIALSTKNFAGDFAWDTDLQVTVNRNKLVALDGTAAAHIEGYGQWSDVVSVSRVGEPLYSFYGYKVVGVYRDLDDLQNSPKPEKYPTDGVFNRANTTWVGDLKFADISGPDGVPDGIIDTYDRTNIGSPMPKFTFGINNTFRYRNFDLNVFLNGSYGNKVMNYMGINLSNMLTGWNNQLVEVTRRANLQPIDPGKSYPADVNGNMVYNWFEDVTNIRVTNPDTKVPRAIFNDPNDNDRISDRYIEDGSYLRIRNIALGYTLPSSVTQRYKVANVRVYVNIQNLYTFTKYTGYDPEVGASMASANVFGLDNGRYPQPRMFSAGVNLSF